jgi:hypothetical protein
MSPAPKTTAASAITTTPASPRTRASSTTVAGTMMATAIHFVSVLVTRKSAHGQTIDSRPDYFETGDDHSTGFNSTRSGPM